MLRIVFMGSPDFAVPALEALVPRHEVALVVTQPDKPAGRGKRLTPPPVKAVAERHGLSVIQPRSARKPEFLQALREARPDVAVVVAYGKILPADVLAVPLHGCLNIHGSLLPTYRGAAPIQRALLNGDTETGITIMRLDEGMDTGPMLLRRAVPIEPTDTAGRLHDRLAPVGAELLVEALDLLEAGELREEAQDHDAATYAPMLAKGDGEVAWDRSAQQVCAHVRGMDPWPGAFTSWDGVPLKLFGAETSTGDGRPGEVLSCDAGGLRVACDSGACLLAEVQVPGKRRMTMAAFSAGRTISPGTILGRA